MDIKLGEETLTDINLLDIQLAHHTEIEVKKFDKPDEGKNGADWEWWFTGITNKKLGLRVQAKIIDANGCYPQLHYMRNNKKHKPIAQTEKLINDARSNAMIPLYCLYTEYDLRQYIGKLACNSFCGSSTTFGCSLASAFSFMELKAKGNKNHVSGLIMDMIPWHCLFCYSSSPTSGQADLPHRALFAIKQYLCRDGCDDKYISGFSLADELPHNRQCILDATDTDEIEPWILIWLASSLLTRASMHPKGQLNGRWQRNGPGYQC